MKKFVSGFCAATVLVAGAAHADTTAADPNEPLFKKGRVVFDAMGVDVSLGSASSQYQGYVGPLILSSTHTADGAGSLRKTMTTSSYGLNPSLDYFVTDRLSVGGLIGFQWDEFHAYDATSTGATHSNTHGPDFQLAARVGYAIPISKALCFWPRVSAGLFEQHDWINGFAGGVSWGEFVQGNFSLAARLAPHVLLELGPVVTYRVISLGGDEGRFFQPSSEAPIDAQLDVSARSSFRVDF